MKKRIIGAIIIVGIFIPFLIIGELPFSIFMSILGLFSLYELLKVHENEKKIPVILKVIAYIFTICFCLYDLNSIEFKYHFDYRVMALLIFAFLSPMVFINSHKKYNLNDALFLVGSVLFIGFSYKLIIITRNFDINYVIYLGNS